ncbi:MAG TPA: PilZ domain-containing protein, partial [Polyangia bacterium]
MRLLAELVELDRQIRIKRQPLTLQQKQRRAQIAQDLHRFALARQRAEFKGPGEQRRDPRANVRLRVQMIGGPRPIELQSDSLAVGGMSLTLTFAPRLGDRLHLRLVPPQPDEPFAVDGEVV